MLLHFEIKKEYACERRYKLKVLEINEIIIKREIIDKTMKDFKIGNRSQGWYMSLRSINLKNRVGALNLSNIYNKIGNFEVLE